MVLKTRTFVFATMVVGHESPFFYAFFSIKWHLMGKSKIYGRIKEKVIF